MPAYSIRNAPPVTPPPLKNFEVAACVIVALVTVSLLQTIVVLLAPVLLVYVRLVYGSYRMPLIVSVELVVGAVLIVVPPFQIAIPSVLPPVGAVRLNVPLVKFRLPAPLPKYSVTPPVAVTVLLVMFKLPVVKMYVPGFIVTVDEVIVIAQYVPALIVLVEETMFGSGVHGSDGVGAVIPLIGSPKIGWLVFSLPPPLN